MWVMGREITGFVCLLLTQKCSFLGLKIVVFLSMVSAMCLTFPCLPPTNLYYLINSVDKSKNLVFHVPTDAAPQFL